MKRDSTKRLQLLTKLGCDLQENVFVNINHLLVI